MDWSPIFIIEFLLVGGCVLGWACWELWTVRKPRQPTRPLYPPAGSGTRPPGHAEGQHRPHDGG
ncbi:hypothetical protein [Zavarzinia sp. CC-PAN008]|uniref:hypothetical protein n=1 Tax=Zavarzinia sp. CC-PAN008 TaxID=3243332 RepID=UPI003F74333B